MRSASVLLLVSIGLMSSTYALSMTGDFITGFESGIFLRGNPDMLDDYGCPEPVNENEKFKQFQTMI